jgi:hypothetical protein
MKKSLIAIAAALALSACATLQKLLMEPTALETITALREVLNSSAFRTINKLAKIQRDGVESLLPEELQPVLTTLKNVGLGNEIDKVTKAIGDASGVVLDESKGIMADAVKEVKFTDAVAIVTGAENAATIAMKNAMYGAVKKRYSARLHTQLEKTDANKYWPMAQSAHNLFARNKIEGSLSDFLAERAVDALFIGMGKEEAVIRQNPESLGKAVVTKVFDYYKNRSS